MRIICVVLEEIAPIIRLVVFDGEQGAQSHLRQVLHGAAHVWQCMVSCAASVSGCCCVQVLMTGAFPANLPEDERREMSHLPFLRDLRYDEFPDCCLPRIPAKRCWLGHEPFFCLPGPLHALKNVAGQASSANRVLYYGRYFADSWGLLQHGLPVPAFCRSDPMSDRLSPFFLPRTLVSWANLTDFCCFAGVDAESFFSCKRPGWRFSQDCPLEDVEIPWHLRGCLLWSLTTALCVVTGLQWTTT